MIARSILLAVTISVTASTPVLAQQAGDGAPFADGRFSNPHSKSIKKGFGAYLRMRWFGDDEWADYAGTADRVPVAATDVTALKSPNPDVLQATWIGHSTVLIQYKGKTVLTDPIFSKRAAPVSFAGPARVTPPGYAIIDLPPVDLIVISHNHYDHLDKPSLDKLAANSLHIAAPLGVGQWIKAKTEFSEQVTEFDWWQRREISGITVTATPSQHWSGRSTTDRYKTLWAAWAITIEDKTIWFGGDTGYNNIQFKEIGKRLASVDFAIIPIGAYAPRWFMQSSHANPEEAVLIHQEIGATQSIGVHWGTFPLTSEPIDEPPARLKKAMQAASLEPESFKSLAIGETIKIP